MSAGEAADAEGRCVAGAVWPEIAVRVEARRIVPRWFASSLHPDFGVVRGRGISRETAVRSLVRGIRRRSLTAERGASAGSHDAPARALPP